MTSVKRKAAKPRPEPRAADGTHSVLPMKIQVGDRLTNAGFDSARDCLRPSAT